MSETPTYKDLFLCCPKMRAVGRCKKTSKCQKFPNNTSSKNLLHLTWDIFPGDTSESMMLDAEKGGVKG